MNLSNYKEEGLGRQSKSPEPPCQLDFLEEILNAQVLISSNH
jgi:hypothetical protein